MTRPQISVCPGSLHAGHQTYSVGVLRRMFEGRQVSHVLAYDSTVVDEYPAPENSFQANRMRISLSGAQEKASMVLQKNKLRLTEPGERGTYILKPIPSDLQNPEQVPANEHLTMQIARQVYGIKTAENVLVFFGNGEPAYLTKRFDALPHGDRLGTEDFASLGGKTSQTAGRNFKYEGSYEYVAQLIRQYVPAYRVVLEQFFTRVLFNYLFGNGDAHLKNFSVLETPQGDYQLSPAYDLINTRLHMNDSDLALEDGLFADEFETESFRVNGYLAYDDFLTFGQRLELVPARLRRILQKYRAEQPEVPAMTRRSFLSADIQQRYLAHYQDKRRALNYSFAGNI